MAFPWEVALPFAAVALFTTISNAGPYTMQSWDNDWKPPRVSLDEWDIQMMERDRRLTGSKRGQRDDPVAPAEFATNSIFDNRQQRWL